MANQEQVELLKRSVKEWNKWRTKNPEVEINLIYADLQGIELFNANLKNAYLLSANLNSAHLKNANLNFADLENAHLANADLSSAQLKNANLNSAFLYSAYLEKADLSSANLAFAKLLSANLEKADLSSANLTFADLLSANLNSAQLKNANLNFANLTLVNLENSDLSNAFLAVVKALKTSFKGATLTGACIADWHTNSETNFEDVVCDYIYRQWDGAKQEPTERYPSDPNRNFAPGEFTKIYQQVRETVDLFFGESIDWQVFLTSYQNVQLESNYGELDICAIKKLSDGSFVISVEVPATSDKAEIERVFFQKYKKALSTKTKEYRKILQSKNKEIQNHQQEIIQLHREKSTDLMKIIELQAQQTINIEAKAVAGDNIKQSGNFGIGVNQGEISGHTKVVGVLNEAEKQNLQTAAHEIQSLLDQLDKDYGNQTAVEKMAVATEIVKAVDKNTKLKTLLTSLKSGSMAALDSFLDHPAASFVITFLDTWHQEQLDG